MKAFIPFIVAVATAGCLDFAEPDLPDIGAPAILEANINLRADGTLVVNAELVPGLTLDALTRNLPRGDSIVIYGNAIQPHSVLEMERRIYHFGDNNAARLFDEPVTVQAPIVDGVRAETPQLNWRTARRIGSDTLRAQRGRDLVVPVGRSGTQHSAKPQREEWILFLTSEEQTYRVGANGPPPDSIVVPARWVPAANDGKVRLVLWHSLNSTVRELPGDYILSVSALIEVGWELRLTNE